MTLTLKDFNYNLPEDLIAQSPLAVRDQSRMLFRDKSGTIYHKRFNELPSLLKPGTVLVYNNSRVIPGRILSKSKNGGNIEIMLLRPISEQQNIWQALGKPFRKLKEGTTFDLGHDCRATILRQDSTTVQPFVEIQFSLTFNDLFQWLERHGSTPLPPYIHRNQTSNEEKSDDKERYQTIYASIAGSVAAPTAGLHFTDKIWKELEQAGIELAPLTLHVGGGTFLPVKVEIISEHRMHTESYCVPQESWEKISKAREEKRPIIATGTTSLRCLEAFALRGENPAQTDCWHTTDLFIYPKGEHDRYKPWGVSGLITNFHQPESSLLMLVSALIGRDELMRIYAEAIEQKYRFLSYGDTSLLCFD